MKRALVGFGGHAREVLVQIGENITCFVDEGYEIPNTQTLPLSQFNPEEYEIMVVISNPTDRDNIINRLPLQTKYFTFIHPTALILSDTVHIGEGSFIGAYSILTTNIEIGKHSILNRSCHIGHDTVAGDFLTMMPGAVLSGNCKLGHKVYLGTNSAVREKLTICNEVVVGLNAGVVSHITKSGTYVGVPAIKK